jgi:Fic family protein
LQDGAGQTVYTPPSPEHLLDLMTDLERFINDPAASALDPLVKMALIHHQFESIHPFYDGNGRTGRIINVLYLVKEGLLESPVLYLSRAIVRTKADYYRLLQTVREQDTWEEWVLYMLGGVEQTAREGITTIQAIKALLMDYKHRIRAGYRFYSQDLINNLFSHPYTKIDFVQRDLKVSRLTATRYLEALAKDGFLEKQKIGRHSYYINEPLYRILTGEAPR